MKPGDFAARSHTATKACIRLAPFALLLAICLPALALDLSTYPSIWFDEGYRTSAARTIEQRGVYGTYTVDGYVPFDPGTSSGPVELFSIALSFRLLGPSIAAARAVSVVYALLALCWLYVLASFIYRRGAGLFVVIVLLATPPIDGVGFVLLGRQVLSELPALALILPGLWLWFRSWRSPWWSIAAGLLIGLGMLSKLQFGIALLPAMVIIAVARGWPRPHRMVRLMLPTLSGLAVIAGWALVGRLSVPEAIRQQNSVLLFDAIWSNLFTPLHGRALSHGGMVIIGIVIIGVAGCFWRLHARWRGMAGLSNAQWAELTLALYVLGYMVWFALFSVGWSRYAFGGLVVGLLLFGKLVWDTVCWSAASISRHWMCERTWIVRGALAVLVTLALVGNITPIIKSASKDDAQAIGAYISATIPPTAVIETWEWELDALSSHWRYHHPNQRYLFAAIRQFSHGQQPFTLDYNLLEANPDYLITGQFSDWTHLYDRPSIAASFQEIKQIGVYRVYQRIR